MIHPSRVDALEDRSDRTLLKNLLVVLGLVRVRAEVCQSHSRAGGEIELEEQ